MNKMPYAHSLEQQLIVFNLLPSLTLHSSKHTQFVAPEITIPEKYQPAWHRHWSAVILRQLNLQDSLVLDREIPFLPIALLQPEQIYRLAMQTGLLLYARSLRKNIAGGFWQKFLEFMTPEDILIIAHAQINNPLADYGEFAEGPEQIIKTGFLALLACAKNYEPAMATRMGLKLPAEYTEAATVLDIDTLAVLGLALSIIRITDATWLSLFPVIA